MKFFDYEEPTNNHLADDQHCIQVLYNPVFYTFITAHAKSIKIWDATTGVFKTRFRGRNNKPIKGEITCICLDDRKRKLFVGTSHGNLKTLNIKNGAIGRKFKKDDKKKKNKRDDQKEDISCLTYYHDESNGEKTSVLIASSWDKKVRFYDDGDSAEETSTARHTMSKHTEAVNYIDFRAHDKFCASCGDDGIIHIFNYLSLRAEGQIENVDPHYREELGGKKELAEMKVCRFLAGTDLLVTSDLDGYIKFWCISSSSHPLKNKLVAYIRDESPGELIKLNERQEPMKPQPQYVPIRAIEYNEQDKILYTGDEMGYLIKWDISRLIEKVAMLSPDYVFQKQAD